MPQKITDLSDLISPPKKVRFQPGGTVYELPGDIPSELFLSIQHEADRQRELQDGDDPGDQTAVLATLADQLFELFKSRNPKLDRLPPEINLTQLLALIPRVYGPPDEQPAVEEGGERPSSAGTRSTSSKRQSKSRS